ncbi:MFS transporter [Shewanella surugensis]|uniref:MFS transporter n=1 Tax=Shewanella surugensis TaxID=212020 RepID=A0ABT0LIV3_9GAMM|nr:MFS transporter [Shewanella surugensis]MCL1127633.1 MFS transporter [Shewanella surugensis]
MSVVNQVNSEKRLIAGISIASIVIYINLYLVQGMLPLIADHFTVSMSQATLLLSVTSFTLALSLLFFAILSDRIGRKMPALVSLYLIAFIDLLMMFTHDFSLLLILRMLQGVLLAALPAVAMAYFKDELGQDALLKAGAIYITVNSLGGIFGRLLGGTMSEYLSWTQSMQLLFVLTLIGCFLSSYYLPKCRFVKPVHEKPKGFVNKTDIKGFSIHLKDLKMRLVFLIGGTAFMVMVNQFSYIQLHLMAAPFSWGRFEVTFIFLCYLSGTFASYRSGKWIQNFGLSRVLLFCIGLMLLGVLVTLMDSITLIFFGFLISAFGFFLLHSSCNTWVAMRASEHRSKATALYLCTYYIGAAIGGPYLLPFWQHWGWNGVVLGVVLGLFITLLLVAKYISVPEGTGHELSVV